MHRTGFPQSATRRALAIPEVATLIFGSGSLSRPDLASLCQVSRYMLGIGTPLLWRNAAAEDLLGLIEDVYFGWGWSDNLNAIILNQYVDDKTFKRFHTYATHVQTLEIYGRKSRHSYVVKGWNALRTEIEARGRPLLPNLKTIRFQDTSPSHGLEEVQWITTFATSGVREVSLVPNRPLPSGQISFSIASTIVETIFKLCPGIQTLSLAANDETYPDNIHNARLLAALSRRPAQPWYQALHGLTRLHHLTISEGWFHPASIQVLGHLPELESLTICPGTLEDFDYMFETSPTLLDGSFPSLIYLSIIGIEDWGIGTILEAKRMVHQVTNMRLKFHFDEFENDTEFKARGVERIFEGIHNAPCLQELYIHFTPRPGEGPASVYDSIRDMGPHPSLESIQLDNIRIDKEYRRSWHSIRKLSSIWPNVRSLSMPSQHATIQDLEDFATLSNLNNLTVKLNLKSSYHPEKPNLERAPLRILASSGPVRLNTNYKDLLHSGRALLTIWPSLERVTWTDEDPARVQLADFFNTEVLPLSREFLYGSPREDSQSSATKTANEMKLVFQLILAGLEEVDSDSDSDSDFEESDAF